MDERASQRRMYCCKCFYPLTGLSSYCCPECGKRFHPENSRTFLAQPRRGLNLPMPSQNTLLTFGLFGLAVIIMLAIGGIVGHAGPMGIGLMPYNYYPEPLSKRNSKTQIRGRNPKSLVAPGPYAPLSTKFNERLIASMPKPSVDSGDLQATPASPPWRVSLRQPDSEASD